MTIPKKSINKLADRAVYLVLNWGLPSTWKQVETKETSTELRSRKRLIKSSVLTDMRRLRYTVKRMLQRYSLNSMFRPGVYVVPLDYVAQADETLQSVMSQIEGCRARIESEWPKIIADARTRLGELFDPSDYGSAAQAAQEFEMSYRYVPIASTPEILQSVAADTYKADLERSKAETTKELEAFRQHLRGTLVKIVDNMRETLSRPDGERRVFGKRFFVKLDDFLGTFDQKNLSDDGALKDVVKQLRKVANGTDVATLKTSEEMQAALDTSLASISEHMTSMLQNDEGRMIDLS